MISKMKDILLQNICSKMTYLQALPFELQQELSLLDSDPWHAYDYQQILFPKLTSSETYWNAFYKRFIGGNNDKVTNHECIYNILVEAIKNPKDSLLWCARNNAHIIISHLDRNCLNDHLILESCAFEATVNNSTEYVNFLITNCTLTDENLYIYLGCAILASFHCFEPLYSKLKQITETNLFRMFGCLITDSQILSESLYKYTSNYGTKNHVLASLTLIYAMSLGGKISNSRILGVIDNKTLFKMIDRRHIDYIFKHYGIDCRENIITLFNMGMSENLLTPEQRQVLKL